MDDSISSGEPATPAEMQPRPRVEIPDKTVVVTMSWSDTRDNQRSLKKLFAKHPFLRATFYVNSPRVKKNGHLTVEDLQEFQAMGHEIGGHAIEHTDLTKMSRKEAIKNICNDRVAWMEYGFPMTSFGYPSSSFSEEVGEYTRDCGYNNGRETGSLDENEQESIPPQNLFDIRLDGSYKYKQHDLKYLKEQITSALKATENGGRAWVMISFHDMCKKSNVPAELDDDSLKDGDAKCGKRTYHSDIADLDKWATWMKDQPRLMHLTAQEVVGGCLRPAVTGEDVIDGKKSPSCTELGLEEPATN
jgi:peptidoglycan/xylan/chitin deacetylase (PgdA/CDA1 family)